MLGNLLHNAAKYTPDGGRIRVSARCVGDQAVLEVADNGIGIPPQEQGKLFQMFVQLQHTAARAQGGLGIGLTVVRSLVDLHGGTVTARSGGPGKGSEFTVLLPRAQPSDADPPVAAAPPGHRASTMLVAHGTGKC